MKLEPSRDARAQCLKNCLGNTQVHKRRLNTIPMCYLKCATGTFGNILCASHVSSSGTFYFVTPKEMFKSEIEQERLGPHLAHFLFL